MLKCRRLDSISFFVCIHLGSDQPCIDSSGYCQYDGDFCPDHYETGLCSGPTDRRCCLESEFVSCGCKLVSARANYIMIKVRGWGGGLSSKIQHVYSLELKCEFIFITY